MEFMVELRNITKTYPGSHKKANNKISLCLKQGEILCIAGENGAGKTTLMQILCGIETPDAGEIFINGKKEVLNSPLEAKKLGIGMVHQHFVLFPEYTVAENMVMGDEPRKWGVFFDSKKAAEECERIIKENNFNLDTRCKVKDLSQGEKQQLEICRILRHNAQIIVLDEPTSVLTEQETISLFKKLKELASNGKSIILITHKLNEIKTICDRAAVIRGGELAGIRANNEIDENEIAGMITGDLLPDKGEKNTAHNPAEREGRSEEETLVLAFDNVTVLRQGQKRPLLDKVSFSVKAGEILGFAGVGGNGLKVVEAVLGGFLFPESGKITRKGKDITGLNTRRLRKQGLAYVPSDRLHVGSALTATIEENMINSGVKLKDIIKNYNIEGARAKAKALTLSGGNLQKLILAREIECLTDYIVFSEPTWGLDIASSRFIMKEIASLRDKGAAIILISTNMDEILSLADRIIVMNMGKIAAEYKNNERRAQ